MGTRTDYVHSCHLCRDKRSQEGCCASPASPLALELMVVWGMAVLFVLRKVMSRHFI